MNYANQQSSNSKRLGTALLSILVTVGVCGSIIFGMAGGLDTGHAPNSQMAAASSTTHVVAQR